MNLLYCGDSNIKDGLYLSIRSILEVEKGILNIYVLKGLIKIVRLVLLI